MTAPQTLWSHSAAFPVLTTLTLIPLLAMIAILLSHSPKASLRFGFVGTLLNVALSIYLLLVFDHRAAGVQLLESVHVGWLSYSVGVDGMNILFIPLTAVLAFLTLVYTVITRHVNNKAFVACLLAYETILIGAFAALNLMQFWLWSALELLPLMLLTVWAGTGQNRRWVVTLLLQYWGSSLLMVLAGFLFLAFGLVGSDHDLTFDWLILKENNAYLHDEVLIFILLFFGYAIRMPLFPFHGWLPLLAEQGTVATAGVFVVGLKLGLYALIRFILPILPGVAEQWAPFVLILGLISVVYGALLAMMQINVRRLLAFVALSHSGLLIIGVFCFNAFGLQGSLLLAIAYGLASAGMFFSVGLIYQRTRTAYLPRLGSLLDKHTTIGVLFLLSAFSTMVMPGTPGFDSAHLLTEGIIEEYGWAVAIVVLLGNVLAAALLLRAFQQMFIATAKRHPQPYSRVPQPAPKERLITLVLALLLVTSGFYTTPWLNYISAEVTVWVQAFPIHQSQRDEASGATPKAP
ncbi:NADH-quinone oxidoreductase subunit M [Methylovulum psychrotolerans]|uniref:complex I subunit 4 family protein n=1 Tax=Methylovulum psychrotolerans TaxID=1704499 RepID=UPI001BFFC77F|nr:NADH-quinone oxidoreductase subunit M [Methylovulum psychrotolerans]MBT9096210.1 NADH-quinone oxidoreductase subunit M [Methylovulum psychrotolerans]